jgi:hypothetical protein
MDDRILGIPGDRNDDGWLRVRFRTGGRGGIQRSEPDIHILQPVSRHAG